MPTAKKTRPAGPRSAAAGGTWQAEKSLLTQTQILQATMQCLIEIGYAQTTTDKIAQRAGVSRGAMTHHFKSRAAVFLAAAQYITELRAAEYDEAISKVKVPRESLPTLEDMRAVVGLLQKYYAKPSFIALHELLRGARTDEALRDALIPLEQAMDARISASLVNRFPVWAEIRDVSEMLRDMILSCSQGIAIEPVGYIKGPRLQRLLDLLAAISQQEFEKAYFALHGPKALERSKRPRRDVA